MHFMMLLTSVLPEIPEMEHLLRSDDGCMKTHGNAILAGCPLLLQLWSYERLAVGRPMVSHEPYHGGMYGDEEDERPTMGTI